MKRIFTILFVLTLSIGFAQQTGLIMENFGKVYHVDNPDLKFEKDKEYKVIFDIYTDSSEKDSVNPLLKSVANYLQVHTQNGVSKENMKIAVILHGVASKNVLNNETHLKQYKSNNPNIELIKALKNADVELFAGGQSYYGEGYDFINKLPEIKMALSAITALVWYQTAGYQIINFN